MTRLERIVVAALDADGAPARGEHLLVAVSGGPDSTALLAALAGVAPARGLALTAATVDHGLRGAEGAADAARAASLAASLGVACVVRTVAVAGDDGAEGNARRARHAALAAIADDVGASRIVFGHTADDQAETVLLRLARGAGRRGLGGMRAVRGRLFRPLLGATRADVRRFLAVRGLPFAVDRTNADLRHRRNRVRRLVLPFLAAELNPRIDRTLVELAARLRDEDAVLAGLAKAAARRLVDGDTLAVGVAGEPRAIGRRVVRVWLARHGRVTAGHVEAVLALACGPAGGAIAVPGAARVVREGDRLVHRPGRGPVATRFALPIAPGETVLGPGGAWRLTLLPPRPGRPDERPAAGGALFDADRLASPLVVRSPAAGDRIRLPGVGTRKLQDLLVDRKVPREARARVPVLVGGGEVLWVAGLARGTGAALGPETTRIVEGRLEPGV